MTYDPGAVLTFMVSLPENEHLSLELYIQINCQLCYVSLVDKGHNLSKNYNKIMLVSQQKDIRFRFSNPKEITKLGRHQAPVRFEQFSSNTKRNKTNLTFICNVSKLSY